MLIRDNVWHIPDSYALMSICSMQNSGENILECRERQRFWPSYFIIHTSTLPFLRPGSPISEEEEGISGGWWAGESRLALFIGVPIGRLASPGGRGKPGAEQG